MNILLSDKTLIQKIKEYSNPNWIWIEIWEISQHEIQIVVTINKTEYIKLGDHKIFRVCSSKTDEPGETEELKKYGTRITRILRKHFPDSEVHSRLYYR